MDLNPLPLVEKASRMGVAALGPLVQSGEATQQQIDELCGYLRTIAVAELLMTGTAAAFFANLHHSASAYLEFLGRPDAPGRRVSRALPLLDAIACDDFDLARDIAARLGDPLRAELEYEEDYLYIRAIAAFATEASVAAELASYEAILAGAEDLRFALCGALAGSDSPGFNESLARFLEVRRLDLLAKLDSGALNPDEAATTRHVSIEALALLRLAERRGMTTEREYASVPSTARIRRRVVQPPRAAWTTAGEEDA